MPKLTHPGEILRKEYLEPAGLKAVHLARATGLSTGRISELLSGKRDITAEIALRLARATGASARLWLGLQSDYDLLSVEKKKAAIIRKQTSLLHAHDAWATAE
ncbi:MAG: HigA family addiction module antitoxin [Alphaproteobacteria bacterium]